MPPSIHPGQQALDYHERTKHHVHRYARSSGYMDWDNQPAPFRTYAGVNTVPLPLAAADPPLAYTALFQPATAEPPPFDLSSIGLLLELSLGLSAWKAAAGQRWALRMNPSSGNLHPTEAHLITAGIGDLPDGIYHYHPLDHRLETRALMPPRQARALTPHFGSPCLLVALSSIFWREAWKYGERAYRYCQHDIGHALAALRLSARLQNRRLIRLAAADDDIAAALGFDRTPWAPHEAEEPALIAAVLPTADTRLPQIFPLEASEALKTVDIQGRPNRLSPRHQAWDIIPETDAACRQPRATVPATPSEEAPSVSVSIPGPGLKTAAAVIRQRRSAQAFDPSGMLDRDAFLGILDRTLPRPACPPFDADSGPARISLVLFVHRIREVAPGLYAFIRHPTHRESLRQAAATTFAWTPPVPGFPLYLLEPGDVRAEAIDLSCRQEIAGFSTFSLGMLARFEPEVRDTPWVYRQLFWEAGMIGQVLYLEAEARGVRGTGIGCYFDDPVHERVGLKDRTWQSLYHFTIGFPAEDARLQTLPPYGHLDPHRQASPRADRADGT
jgi:SagB-type dehydrogenase family enzyme